MVVEVEDEVPHEQLGRRDGETAPAVVRVEHDRVEVRDPAPPVHDREGERAGRLSLHLDHEAAVVPRVAPPSAAPPRAARRGPRAETAAMNGSTSSCEASATRKSTSAFGRTPEQEALAGERRRHPCGVAGAGSRLRLSSTAAKAAGRARPERDAREDQDEAEGGVQRDLLVEDEDAVDERDRRQQVRDERGPCSPVAGQQPVEEKQRERRAEDAEDDDRPDRLPARHSLRASGTPRRGAGSRRPSRTTPSSRAPASSARSCAARSGSRHA